MDTTYDYDPNELLAGIDDNERADSGQREWVPASLYPVDIVSLGVNPSAQKGTPGLELALCIAEGPFKDARPSARDTVIWLSGGSKGPGGGPKPDSKYVTQHLGLMKNMTKQVTGQAVDSAALTRHGFRARSAESFAYDLWRWSFDAVQGTLAQPTDICTFWSEFMRVPLWDGKRAIVALGVEQQTAKDGSPQTYADGAPVYANRIINFFALTHAKYGWAHVQKVCLPAQVADKAAMGR